MADVPFPKVCPDCLHDECEELLGAWLAAHEVATERTVQLAAVIEQVESLRLKWNSDPAYPITKSAAGAQLYEILSVTDAAGILAAHDREVAEKAWDEGHNAGWNEGVENAQGYFSQHDNPYREGSDG